MCSPSAALSACARAPQPETYWIEPAPHYTALNADAVAITQSGSNPLGGGIPVGTYPIHQMGLHGEGEVIGVGDSGLDVGHCFFEDQPGRTRYTLRASKPGLKPSPRLLRAARLQPCGR